MRPLSALSFIITGPGLIAAGIVLIVLAGCNTRSTVFKEDLDVLGTSAEIVIAGLPSKEAYEAARAVEKDLEKLDHIGYTFESAGELHKLNEAIARSQALTVSAELKGLIEEAGRLYTASNGLFNPAAGELTALWEYECPQIECKESHYSVEILGMIHRKVEEVVLKQQPSMDDLSVDGNDVTSRKPVVKLEFGDMIRGFALDQGIAHLKEMGVENAMIILGNGVRTIGARGNKPWWIRLPIPGDSEHMGEHMIGTIESSGEEAVVTVHAFDKSIGKKGSVYRHVVDPRSGFPVWETDSVTVIHESATTANAAAAALLVNGRNEWSSIADKMGVHSIMMITRTGTIYTSQKMEERINRKQDRMHLHLMP